MRETTDDPLGALELELVDVARRRSERWAVVPRRPPDRLDGVVALAFAGFAVILLCAVVVLLASH